MRLTDRPEASIVLPQVHGIASDASLLPASYGLLCFLPSENQRNCWKYDHRAFFVLTINGFRMQNADPGIIPPPTLLAFPFPSSSLITCSLLHSQKCPNIGSISSLHLVKILKPPVLLGLWRHCCSLLLAPCNLFPLTFLHLPERSMTSGLFRTPSRLKSKALWVDGFTKPTAFLLYKPGTFLFHWVGPHITSLRLWSDTCMVRIIITSQLHAKFETMHTTSEEFAEWMND